MDTLLKTQVSSLVDAVEGGLSLYREHGDNELRERVEEGREKAESAFLQFAGFSLDERVDSGNLGHEEWIRAIRMAMDDVADPFVPRNRFDREFMSALKYAWLQDIDGMVRDMLQSLDKWKREDAEAYAEFVAYLASYSNLWGNFKPGEGDYETLYRRAAVLKRHSYDFLWLYRRLEDYLSKRTLTAILLNWECLEMTYFKKIRSVFPDYWEPDFFPDNKGAVMVDLGAYVGDSIEQYVETYGQDYRKIYAYEISGEVYKYLCLNMEKQGFHDVEARHKGAGSRNHTMYVLEHEESPTSNTVSEDEQAGEPVEVVRLEDDLEEDPTFIKMDIEGAERDALLGCEGIIRRSHPDLAICTYHGYDDLWRIPLLIEDMHPAYRMHLRLYGKSVIPTEFVLLCGQGNVTT